MFLEKLIKIQSRDPTLPGKSDYVDAVGLGMQQRAAAYSALAAKQKVSTALNNVYHTQHRIHDMVYDEHLHTFVKVLHKLHNSPHTERSFTVWAKRLVGHQVTRWQLV